MKIILSTLFLLILHAVSAQYITTSYELNQQGALKLAEQASLEAQKLNKIFLLQYSTVRE